VAAEEAEEAAAAIGDATVLAQAEVCKQAFEAQRAMLLVVSKAAKPSQADFASKCIPPTSEKLGEVQAKVDRKSKNYNALQAMGEAIPALGWVMVEKTPGPHVADMWESGAYYQMKIMKEFKGNDEKQMKLAVAMKAIFVTLQAYIKEHHRTGLEWKTSGVPPAAGRRGRGWWWRRREERPLRAAQPGRRRYQGAQEGGQGREDR